MNYTLQATERSCQSLLIEQQGEDCILCVHGFILQGRLSHLKDEDGEIDYDNVVEDPELIERIFNDVGNIDYIYTVIQECVDEVTEEQFMINSTGDGMMDQGT